MRGRTPLHSLCTGNRLKWCRPNFDARTHTTLHHPASLLLVMRLQCGRVYNLRQAKADIDSIYSTGLFEDVNIVPQEADDSTEAHPKVKGLVCVWASTVCTDHYTEETCVGGGGWGEKPVEPWQHSFAFVPCC
jgi:hypothetical protein